MYKYKLRNNLQGISKPIKIGIPVALAIFLIVGSMLQVGVFGSKHPLSAMASRCTLKFLNGNVEIFNVEANLWEEGIDGATLVAGTRIKTSPESYALLTFFEGSTIELNPNTELEIELVGYSDEGSPAIILKQQLGRTWSRVKELVRPLSYEIKTPSANAVVRGTSFLTEVDNEGTTNVRVVDGSVIVSANGIEATVKAGFEVDVQLGSSPPQPTETELLMPTYNGDTPEKGPDGQGLPDIAEGEPPSKGTGPGVSQGDDKGSDRGFNIASFIRHLFQGLFGLD
ncbi:FecR domain-containing protein [Chloroflexota bacterium]